MTENKGKDDYQEPSFIYKLPDPMKCENPVVASDTRTNEEKERDENQKIFDEKFNNATDPVSYFMTFKVVGISPSQPQGFNPNELEEPQQASSLEDVIKDLLKTDGVGQVIPRALYDELPGEYAEKYADLFTYKPQYFLGNEDNKARYVEFASAVDAQKFIDEQGCKTRVDGKCYPLERDYQLFLSFTNSVALDDMRTRATQWFGYAMAGVIVLAAIIMWIAIGRAIADGRRETAVFRAIGFKRIDISAVYVLYTIMLSFLVGIFAAGIGWIGAHIINRQISPDFTAQAQYAFGGLNMTKEVSLVGIDGQQLLLIFTACFATGLLSMIIPLLSNVRRSPISDMREE